MSSWGRVTISLGKNYSTEHKIDGNFNSFLQKSIRFRNGKQSEFRSAPFQSTEDTKKAYNYLLKHFVEEENTQELSKFVLNHSAEDKNDLTFILSPYAEEKKEEFLSEPLIKRKTFENSF